MDSSGWSSHPPLRRPGASWPGRALAAPPLRDAAIRLPAGARAISRSWTRQVKAPTLRPNDPAGARRESSIGFSACARSVLCAALALTPAAAAARTAEPLADWLAGIGAAAQAQADRDFPAAERAARRALAARPRGVAAARAQAALGLALLARGDALEAADALEIALGSPVSPARAHLAHARGEALLAAGDPSLAARLFAEAASHGGLLVSSSARLREAQALLEAGLAAEALPSLERIARGSGAPSPPVLLALAHALRALGEDERAVAVLRTLWLELPDSPEAETAGAALDAWRSAGGPVPPDTGEERMDRAERLLAAGRPDAAISEVSAAVRADDPAADPERLAFLRALALLSLSRHEEAERAALALAGAGAEEVQRGARLVLARAASRAGRIEEAIRYYEDVASGAAPIPGLPEWRQRDVGDESAFLASWLPYDAGDYAAAIPALERFARARPRSRRAEDARWFAAWSRYRLGRFAEADRAFSALSQGALRDGALYWRARMARTTEARRALYRACLGASNGGWYGLLAQARLERLGGAPRPRALSRARPLPDAQGVWAAGRLSVAVELLGLGLRDEALAELRDLSRSARIRPAAPIVAQLAAFAGDALLPFRMARDHLLPTRRSLRWSHPEPSSETLRRAAEGFGLEAALVLGVLRRESRFDEEARSGAGAEGLMQLRPSTATKLAALLALPPGAAERLSDPAASILLGTHYLSLLLSRFEDPAIAVAAYNAGPAVVAEWVRARRAMPIDEWVESIPYRETRGYVKGVVAEWATYRALAGHPPPAIDPGREVRIAGPGVAF